MLQRKVEDLQRFIKSSENALVALSGGIDSILLSFLTHRILKESAVSMTVLSEFFIKSEKSVVDRFIAEFGITHRFLRISVLNDERVVSNPLNRCYYCKRSVFEELLSKARECGISAVFDGTNTDDLREDRPGIRALNELGVLSPFAEVGIRKRDICELARTNGLEQYIRPSNTCLATRVTSLTRIDERVLNMIEKAEEFMHNNGFEIVRVRYHERNTARIEVPKKDLSKAFNSLLHPKILSRFKHIGFERVSIDLAGYK